MKFAKTLKFKLTIWYSGLLLVFSLAFVLLTNILLAQYMSKENPVYIFPGRRIENPILRDIANEQLENIQQSRLEDLKNIRTISIYSTLPLVLVSFGFGYIITSIQLKPLEQLNKEMLNKSTKNLSKEIKYKDNGDEIASLIKSFNRMSRRLSKSFDSQKEFVENASHELKTPLAIIQANIENAVDDNTITKEELNELLQDSQKSITFMNKLTEDLLLLSALEVNIEKEELDLVEVIQDSISNSKKLKLSKKYDINLSGDISATYMGNYVLLQRAISNIVENSIKYSQGKNIDIAIQRKENIINIKISDDGVGIPKKDREKIFERFYRVDKSRSRKSGGSGLGLSITKEIISKHNGTIKVRNKRGGGTVFEIGLNT